MAEGSRGWRLLPGMQAVRHQILPDAESAHSAMEQVVGISNMKPWTDYGEFYQYIGVANIGNVALLSYASEPVDFNLEASETLYLAGCVEGSRAIKTPFGDVQSTAGGALLLGAPDDCRVSGADSVAVMALQRQTILTTARAMTARSRKGGAGLQPESLSEPFAFSPAASRPLHSALRHIDECYAVDPGLPSGLGLDDVIDRIAVALIAPAVLEDADHDRAQILSRTGSAAFDELIDYIKANLDQPLRLSDLEARSGYSRRTLQYAFLERLGQSPTQWIREQRLCKAMEYLQSSPRMARIKDIALICGYKHKSHFHADFKRRFGMSPSEALRSRL